MKPAWVREYQEWIRNNYVWDCFFPCTFIATVLTGIFYLTGLFDGTEVGRSFLINSIYAHSTGITLFFMWGLWPYVSRELRSWQRHVIATGILFFGVLLGTLLASFFVADLLSITIAEVMRHVLVLNIFISLAAMFVFTAYDRLRRQLDVANRQVREKEVNEQRILQLKAQAELSSLQAKINPHFLFNCLNSIASLISIDPGRAEKAVEKLSRLLRYSLRSSLRNSVPLSEELEVVSTYLELETLRLGERLRSEIVVEGEVAKVNIPGMLLQPLVENSVKHGFGQRVQGGMVRVLVKVGSNLCNIRVEDDGRGFQDGVSTGEGHGLANVKERLDLFFRGNYTLDILHESGVTVVIIFPLENTWPTAHS